MMHQASIQIQKTANGTENPVKIYQKGTLMGKNRNRSSTSSLLLGGGVVFFS